MKFSHVLVCLFLVAFGLFMLIFVIGGLFADVTIFSAIGLLLYIPTLLFAGVLPVIAGFGYFFHMFIHRHDKE